MPACQCEKVSQSEHPTDGPVADQEVLLRQVFLPSQINPDGSLQPTAFSREEFERQHEELPPRRGFSMNRALSADEQGMLARAIDFQARQPAERAEVWQYSAEARHFRSLTEPDGFRSVCVVDRAEAYDRSHAELWGGKPGRTKAAARAVRDQVVACLKPSKRVV